HALGDLRLHIERQPLLGALGDEVKIAADRPKEFGRAPEGRGLILTEYARFQILTRAREPVAMPRHPIERVQVAQAAFPLLDVGLNHVARGARAHVALIALL